MLGDAILDFYVNKKKFDSYKTERGKMNFVADELNKYFLKMKGLVVNDVLTIRDVSITSNHFWGDGYHKINDIGYSYCNKLEPIYEKHNKVALRIIQIDVCGVGDGLKLLKGNELFYVIKNENYILRGASYRLV